MEEVKKNLAIGIYFHQNKTGKTKSPVWSKFNEIFVRESKLKVKNFYFCTNCKLIEYNPCTDGNTNRLRRHLCLKKDDSSLESKIVVKRNDKHELKLAAAKFVSKDLRPFFAIQGEGLKELCFAAMRFGQRNRKATRNDFMAALPTRNTVKAAVAEVADKRRKDVTYLLRRAMETGGVAATSDTWTDDYRHETYMTIVAHVCIYEDNERINNLF